MTTDTTELRALAERVWQCEVEWEAAGGLAAGASERPLAEARRALRAALSPARVLALLDEVERMKGETRLIDWLANGEPGTSSKTMASVFANRKLGEWFGDHPYDPDDFKRCLWLLDAFPEWRPRLVEMAKVSPQWARLVAAWDVLERSFMRETRGKRGRAIGWRAPITYVGITAAVYTPEEGMRAAARNGYDLLAASEIVEAVERCQSPPRAAAEGGSAPRPAAVARSVDPPALRGGVAMTRRGGG